MAARVGQRLSQDDASLVSSGWTTLRPVASRRMTQTSSVSPPALTCPPRLCPFPCCEACFQEGKASCVMELWKRGGWGGWNREEMTVTQRDMDTNRMMGISVRGGLWYSDGKVGLFCFVQLHMWTKQVWVGLCFCREDQSRKSLCRGHIGAHTRSHWCLYVLAKETQSNRGKMHTLTDGGLHFSDEFCLDALMFSMEWLPEAHSGSHLPSPLLTFLQTGMQVLLVNIGDISNLSDVNKTLINLRHFYKFWIQYLGFYHIYVDLCHGEKPLCSLTTTRSSPSFENCGCGELIRVICIITTRWR